MRQILRPPQLSHYPSGWLSRSASLALSSEQSGDGTSLPHASQPGGTRGRTAPGGGRVRTVVPDLRAPRQAYGSARGGEEDGLVYAAIEAFEAVAASSRDRLRNHMWSAQRHSWRVFGPAVAKIIDFSSRPCRSSPASGKHRQARKGVEEDMRLHEMDAKSNREFR